jgi:hypothetical protein
MEEIDKKTVDSLRRNPYWLLYDLVKREERDGCAFLECRQAIEFYERKNLQI